MSHVIWFAIGFFAALVCLAAEMDGTRGECRAAHVGYDCGIGWIVGEAFQ